MYLSIESVKTMPILDTAISEAAKSAFLEGLGLDPRDRTFPINLSLPFYSLSIAGLGTGAEPAKANSLGWIFLTEKKDAKGNFVSGEVPNAPDGSKDGLSTSLSRGFTVDNAWNAYLAFKDHPEVLKTQFELRRLRMSPLHIDAFWLKTPPLDDVLGNNDFVYSFIAFDERVKEKLLPAPEFVQVVRELADKAQHCKPIRTRK